MKAVIIALLIALTLTGPVVWEVVDSLPSCYTDLPFTIQIANGNGRSLYSYQAFDLPAFAHLDTTTGVITGTSSIAGAYPIAVKIGYNKRYVTRQYILNVLDTTKAQKHIWAGKTKNYYDRVVENPFRVVASKTHSTVVSVGEVFDYKFGVMNAVGSPVYAFLNLPDGLVGDVRAGSIRGKFGVAGIYTIGVESADQSGNSAEGFVTVTVTNGDAIATGGAASLNKVTVSNAVPFVFDISAVQAQQISADKELFAALAVVNEAKAELSARQGVFDNINVKLTAAEASADKAAAAAAQANTERENAAARLSQTNKALNEAEDKLNLALLYQAGAKSNVKKAEKNLDSAQAKFNKAQKALAAAEEALRVAQAELNAKKLAEVQANTALQNAQKDFNRANEDLNDAKVKVNDAEEAQRNAEDELTQAKNDLTLAHQAYEQAEHQLKDATVQLANAEAARQAALKVLQDATSAHQKATTALGAAEWNLNQAVAALNVANAAKDAADRTSSLIIANGAPQTSPAVNFKAAFGACRATDLPRYAGSVRVTKVYGDRALLATGNTILFGDCTIGHNLIVEGATVSINGVINPSSKCIEVYKVGKAIIRAH